SQNNAAITAPTNKGYLLPGAIQKDGASIRMVTYTLPGQARREDMAIVQVRVPKPAANSFAAAELAMVTSSIPSVADAFGNGGTAGNINVGFTQYGEGRGGIFNLQNNPAGSAPAKPAANTYTSYSVFGAYNSGSLRRFQNSSATKLNAPAVV